MIRIRTVMAYFFQVKRIFCILLLLALVFPGKISGQTEKRLFKRGLERMEQNNFTLAEIDFSMVIQLNPENEIAFYNRGYCRLRAANYPGAVEDFTRSIEIDHTNYDAFFNRGNALKFIADDIKGRENLESARRVYLQALEDLNFALAHERKDPRYLRARARIKMGLDDIRGAIKDLDQAIKITKGDTPAYLYDRAEAFLELKDFYEALDDIDRLIELNPRNPEGYMFRAAVKEQVGDQSGACLDWSRAGELGKIEAYEFIRERCGR